MLDYTKMKCPTCCEMTLPAIKCPHCEKLYLVKTTFPSCSVCGVCVCFECFFSVVYRPICHQCDQKAKEKSDA